MTTPEVDDERLEVSLPATRAALFLEVERTIDRWREPRLVRVGTEGQLELDRLGLTAAVVEQSLGASGLGHRRPEVAVDQLPEKIEQVEEVALNRLFAPTRRFSDRSSRSHRRTDLKPSTVTWRSAMAGSVEDDWQAAAGAVGSVGDASAGTGAARRGTLPCERGGAMALLYRAIWQDDRPELLAEAWSEVALWLKGKTQGALSVPDSGSVTAGDDEVSVVESSGDDGAILLVRYDEEQGPGTAGRRRSGRSPAPPVAVAVGRRREGVAEPVLHPGDRGASFRSIAARVGHPSPPWFGVGCPPDRERSDPMRSPTWPT